MRRTLAIAIVACTLAPLSASAAGKVSFVEGRATRTPQGGAEAVLALDEQVRQGDTVATGPGARLELTLDDASMVRIGENSRFVVTEVQPRDQGLAVKLKIALGQLWTRVSPRSERSFEVSTERMVAGVRGTVFLVQAGASDAVVVLEGAVDVSGAQGQPLGDKPVHRVEADKAIALDAAGKTEGVVGINGRHDFDAMIRWAVQFDRDRLKPGAPRRDGSWLERRQERRKVHKSERRERRMYSR